MIEGEDCIRYRVHLLSMRFNIVPGRLWGQWVKLSRPTYYERSALQKWHGNEWTVDLWLGLRNPRFEVWGQREGEDDWRPLSKALLDEDRQARRIADHLAAVLQGLAIAPLKVAEPPDPVQVLVEQIRDVREREENVGAAEAWYHLTAHKRPPERKDYAARALRIVYPDRGDFDKAQQTQHTKDGRSRERSGLPCRFCAYMNPPWNPPSLPS